MSDTDLRLASEGRHQGVGLAEGGRSQELGPPSRMSCAAAELETEHLDVSKSNGTA